MSRAIEIETERLLLRSPSWADIPALTALANDKGVTGMTATLPYPYLTNDAEAFVRKLERRNGEDNGVSLAITLRRDRDFAGVIALNPKTEGPVANDEAEIGYWLGRPFWGKGLATEAARALIDYGFETLRLQAIHATCHVMNAASRNVLEKCGLHYVTSGLGAAPARGGAVPIDRFKLNRSNWKSLKAWRPAVIRASPPPRGAACAG